MDECGAPGRLSGCALVPIETKDGKLTPELIQPHLHNFGFCHHSQPKAVYISQASELGTVYTINEVKAIADLLHSYGMFLHMDGARLANACVYLGCSMKEVTVDAGVDILSFGGTKNGMILGEFPQIKMTQKVETNQLFFTLPEEPLKKLLEKYFFYIWDESKNEARFVTSWDTTLEDIESMEASLREVLND